jgi:hypothetical protein
MATKRQKEKKKKDREAKAKSRVLSRRNKMRMDLRDQERSRKLDAKFRDKLKPFVKDPEKKAAIEASEQEKIKDRLERNMQILKALEEEYESEINRKKEINSELESLGHETLSDKLGALEKDARKAHGEDSSSAKE